MWAFGFVGFAFFVFFFTSSCCCLINQVAMLWLLFVLFVGFLGFVMCYLLDCFWGLRFPKPSLLFYLVFVFFVLFFVGFCFVYWFWLLVLLKGFQGQVRLPEGPPHLAINPPYLFSIVLVCFWFDFVCFRMSQKPWFSPWKRVSVFSHVFSV